MEHAHLLGKYREAERFAADMRNISSTAEREGFEAYLSAFLSAARSIMQYLDGAADHDAAMRTWYDDRMANNLLLGFLRDERNANTHERPVRVKTDYRINAGPVMRELFALDRYAKELHERDDLTKADKLALIEHRAKALDDVPTETSHMHRLGDWAPQGALELCEEALRELDDVIKDAHARGFAK